MTKKKKLFLTKKIIPLQSKGTVSMTHFFPVSWQISLNKKNYPPPPKKNYDKKSYAKKKKYEKKKYIYIFLTNKNYPSTNLRYS